MEYQILTFEEHGDDRGTLIALEENKNIPFAIKRVYYMYDTGKDVRRGYHAHRQLEQVLVCVHGQCKILLDDGIEQQVIVLSNPNSGLYLKPGLWREMYDFSEDAVLMVLASEIYDEADYIRDYQKFTEYIAKKSQEGCKME